MPWRAFDPASAKLAG
ncbi:hypothetical protein AGR4C_Lc50239 [Agrobacterium tumefaciens str. Kerr 14]|uniref:Uncharacterized protein n=3 Tax=Agrobacterium tumefaciens complex TaxID=1183400 RepID=A0A1S7RWN5_AGRTU|nr:hypothetical protein AGR4C_Lc50239 [Agrobacterium tumefaciens str. Kerr 14]